MIRTSVMAPPMFDTVILLTGPAEHSVFTTLLRGHNPSLNVIPVFTPDDLAAIEPAWLARARLISFTSSVIVPAAILDQLGYGAYNFRAGPPQYPGWAPAHFALYHNEREFGCTVHGMIARVEAGPVVEAESFAVPPGIGVAALEELAYTKLVAIFWRMGGKLANQPEPFPEFALRWGPTRYSRQAYQQICDIPLTIPHDEIEHRVQDLGIDHFGIVPRIGLHGFRFRVVTPETEAGIAGEVADA